MNTITRNLSLQIDNAIEEFIVRSVQEYGMNEGITVNAKKIYEALEKQVAKKPTRICNPNTRKLERYECPCCHKYLCYRELSYCGLCGQKIDWSDEE